MTHTVFSLPLRFMRLPLAVVFCSAAWTCHAEMLEPTLTTAPDLFLDSRLSAAPANTAVDPAFPRPLLAQNERGRRSAARQGMAPEEREHRRGQGRRHHIHFHGSNAEKYANSGDYPGLPPSQIVRQVLTKLPAVTAAYAQREAGAARGDATAAGDYEWNVGYTRQKRRTRPTDTSRQNFYEWNASLERTFRFPGKAGTDRALGDAGANLADIAYGDARHEAGRQLLAAWFLWLRENATVEAWQAQVNVLKQEARAVYRRVELGDASTKESVQARAALAQAQAQRAQAQVRTQAAYQMLKQNYPELPLQPVELPRQLPEVVGNEEDWLQAYLQHNHEWRLAKAAADFAQLTAQRSRQERLPDPTIGINYSQERGGEEKVMGAFIRIPLPGGARFANARAAEAEALAAGDMALSIEAKIRAEARNLLYAARKAHVLWQTSQIAADEMRHSAEMQESAYRLGEGTLSDLLTARRLAHEAALQSRMTQFDALEKSYRLQLDTHRLWAEDKHQEDANEGHAAP